ncbi:MAG: AbrB/MazE/SpoVT family DNA-binding domain-containing protein [Rhodospirillales bacterium]|nr:MAG: AbrB/MazE/SpoVT family DNA-binding domain-containing protein [Rhodospirillales bacterium]
MRTQLSRWGNSLAVRLPQQIVKDAGLKEGEAIDVDVAGGVVKLRSAKPVYRLKELLARITPDKLPEEIFDDAPRGRELL